MDRFFNMDNKFFTFMSRVADLIILNLLCIVCCIPVVTIGPSIAAMFYVTLKMVRNEESYIVRGFFKSFKQNFKQATIIWLILLLVIALLLGDFLILNYSSVQFPSWIRVALIAILALVLFATIHVFPILARFENTVANTFKNSLYMGILSLPKTILMMACWAIPVLISTYAVQILPVNFGFGISGPVFLNALLYNKTFKRFEPEEESAAGDEDWTVSPEGESGENTENEG